MLLFVSLIAWKCSEFVKENVPVTLLGIFLACFVTNSTVLLPASSLLIVLEYTKIINPVGVVICGALGASTGELVGFFVGRASSRVIRKKWFMKIKNKFEYHPYLWIFVFAVIPLPIFDVAGIIAGCKRLNVYKFYKACFFGKVVKMGSYAILFGVVEQIIKNFA